MKKKYYFFGLVSDTKDAIKFVATKKCRACNFIVNIDETIPAKEGFQWLILDCLDKVIGKVKKDAKKNRKQVKKTGK
jgi:hypothetical protein